MDVRIWDAKLVATEENATTAKIASSLEQIKVGATKNGIPTVSQYETTSEISSMPDDGDGGSGFIWVPLAVLLGIMLLSAVVYLMARNRRRLAHIYCKRKHAPNFNFNEDSDDSAMEQGDLDDPTECLLKGKLQIDNRYENYQTTQVTQTANQNRTYA